METPTNIPGATNERKVPNSCVVNSTLNFTIGTVAIIVAGILGYLIVQYFNR